MEKLWLFNGLPSPYLYSNMVGCVRMKWEIKLLNKYPKYWLMIDRSKVGTMKALCLDWRYKSSFPCLLQWIYGFLIEADNHRNTHISLSLLQPRNHPEMDSINSIVWRFKIIMFPVKRKEIAIFIEHRTVTNLFPYWALFSVSDPKMETGNSGMEKLTYNQNRDLFMLIHS